MNQAGDHDHIEKIITYSDQIPDSAAGRVTNGERSGGGWGKHQFLARGDLKYNAVKKTQYLKDNHLIIHVMKVVCTHDTLRMRTFARDPSSHMHVNCSDMLAGKGGYDCEFVETPPPAIQMECPICLHILKEPCLVKQNETLVKENQQFKEKLEKQNQTVIEKLLATEEAN